MHTKNIWLLLNLFRRLSIAKYKVRIPVLGVFLLPVFVLLLKLLPMIFFPYT